jgi:hypothetical protein
MLNPHFTFSMNILTLAGSFNWLDGAYDDVSAMEKLCGTRSRACGPECRMVR